MQMATESGIVQAVFPEGGLTRDGNMRTPKLGLLDYMLRAFDARSPRDLVFVPVGINYDRVLEDRALLLDGTGEKPGLVSKSATAARFAGRAGLHVAADEGEVGPLIDRLLRDAREPSGAISPYAQPELIATLKHFIHDA